MIATNQTQRGVLPAVASHNAFADRAPPYSAEAEMSVLGGMLIDGDAIVKAIEIVDDSMFYREGNRRLYRAMVRLWERGEVIDAITLSEELKTSGDLEAVGGMPYVAQLLDAVPTAANIEYHARIVREKALRRRMIEAATQVIQEMHSAPDTTEAVDAAERRILAVADTHDRGRLVWVKELLWPVMERIELAGQKGSAVIGLPTGFCDLDEMTAGLHKGELIIVAARPSQGKTAFALGLTLHAAIAAKKAVVVFSMEMSKEALIQRMLISEARVDSGRARNGRLRDHEYPRLGMAAGLLNTAPIYIDDTPAQTISELRAKARRQQREMEKTGKELGLVVVDYLQLMRGPGKTESRQQEVSEISRGLKGLAKELEVPVVALSQLSREVERRPDRRPMMSDLRESGAIEADADLILFLYRPEYYFGPTDKQGNSLEGRAEVIIGKQREGATGTVHLRFEKEFTRFESIVDRPHFGAA